MVTVKRIGARSVVALKQVLANMTPEHAERKLAENVLANYEMNAVKGRLKNVELSGEDFSVLNLLLHSVGAKWLKAAPKVEKAPKAPKRDSMSPKAVGKRMKVLVAEAEAEQASASRSSLTPEQKAARLKTIKKVTLELAAENG